MRAHGPNLSAGQLRYVQRAAASLPAQMRDRYLLIVSDHLAGTPSDAAVASAVDVALRRASAFLKGDHRYDTDYG